MKRVLIMGLLLLLGSAGGAFAQDSQKWTTPAVKGYGGIIYDPDLKIEPDKSLDYKVVFKITSDQLKKGVNAQLWHVARLVNLLADGKIPKAQQHIVAGIAGKATPVVLSDAAYEKRYKKPNPNTELIRELTDAGVKIYVCSQAAAEHHIDMRTELNPHILKSLSLMTDLVNFQLRGYVLMP
jgi:intracellular sulfur oxidation DsrE/DsrF family protein